MGSHSSVPGSVRLVAILFILMGILSAIDMVLAIRHNALILNFGVVGIFTGIGLFCLSPAARIFALILIWLGFILIPIQILVLLLSEGAGIALIPGLSIQSAPKSVNLLCVFASLAFVFYSYNVLTRPRVKGLFQ